ncbi:hypothetical protein CDL15_Pgr012998 [Punica granatum]|uniref:Gnk2-homologous domain-containing protein n=1 Tax=Punica granatum TaxID=22663 RepID=A0A218XEY8_PUNGR|nr:hypothetical protein CDL15_Pgr012998 [Punica granatum]
MGSSPSNIFSLAIASSSFLLLCLLLCNSSISEAEQWPEYRANACYVPSNDSLYFQKNVNTLLSALTSKSTSDYEKGFAYGMEGQGPPDQVFGLFLCRADLRSASCQACISTASQRSSRPAPG